jgi:hypothetical protein
MWMASHRRDEREIGKRVAEDGEAHDLREVGFRPISGNIWAPIVILAIQKSRY